MRLHDYSDYSRSKREYGDRRAVLLQDIDMIERCSPVYDF